MTNAPESRKTHVIRIFGTNEAGERLEDIWADVERWDHAKTVIAGQDKGQWNGHVLKFKWLDDPRSDDYNPDGNPARKTEIVKVCDPSNEDDLDNPEEWIPIPAIVHMRVVDSKNNFQGQQQKFVVDVEAGEFARSVEQRRIEHYDTNIDDDAEAAADADPSLLAYVVTGEEYERDDSTKDEDQYVEHEIVKSYKSAGNPTDGGDANDTTGAGMWQGRQTKLKNQYLIDESVEAKLEETGSSGLNPPYRLDPWQNIININWGDVAVKFYDGAS